MGKKRGGGAERSQPPRFVRRSSQSASGLQIEIAQLIYKVVVGDFAGTGINEGSEGSLCAAVVGQQGAHGVGVTVADETSHPQEGILGAGNGVGYGSGNRPGGEVTGQSSVSDVLLLGCDSGLKAAYQIFRALYTESAGESMIGAGAAGLYIVSAGVINSLDEGNLHSAVGGEEGGLLAVFFYLLRYVLQNELLGAGKAGVASRIGSGGVYKLNAQLFALGLDLIAAACQGYRAMWRGKL